MAAEARPLHCPKCGERIHAELGCACKRLQNALDAHTQNVDLQAGILFYKLRWANLGKTFTRDTFGSELNRLLGALEQLAEECFAVYAKLGPANRKILDIYFTYWVTKKTEDDLRRILDEHFNSWVHFTLHQYSGEGDQWLAPRWLRELLPDGEEQEEPESKLNEKQTLKLLSDLRGSRIEDLYDAVISNCFDRLSFETAIADACANSDNPQPPSRPRLSRTSRNKTGQSSTVKKRIADLKRDRGTISSLKNFKYLHGAIERGVRGHEVLPSWSAKADGKRTWNPIAQVEDRFAVLVDIV